MLVIEYACKSSHGEFPRARDESLINYAKTATNYVLFRIILAILTLSSYYRARHTEFLSFQNLGPQAAEVTTALYACAKLKFGQAQTVQAGNLISARVAKAITYLSGILYFRVFHIDIRYSMHGVVNLLFIENMHN